MHLLFRFLPGLVVGLYACQTPEPYKQRAPAPPVAPSLLGTWSLESVLTETWPKNGGKPFRQVTNLRPGANSATFTKEHKTVQLSYDNPMGESTYRFFGDSLIISDSVQTFRYWIKELIPSRYVAVIQADRPEAHYTLTETHKRTTLARLDSLRIRFSVQD